MTERTIEQHFADWESDTFGFGYGTGEEHVIGALKTFLEAIPDDGGYDYRVLEEKLGKPTAWLMINALCHAHVIEYGTSPRYGWLDQPHGVALAAFVRAHTVDELVMMTVRTEDDAPCYPDFCNCGPDGWSQKKLCHNPFWRAC